MENTRMGKVPEYTKKAVKKYDSKFDKVLVRLPYGVAEIIRKELKISCNAYITELVLSDLKSRGLYNKDIDDADDTK